MGFVFIFKKNQIKSKMSARSNRSFARKQLLECNRFQGLLVKHYMQLNVLLDNLWSVKYCVCLETLSLLIFYDNTHKHWQLLGVLESVCLSALKKRKSIGNSWNYRNILFQVGNFHRFQETLNIATENGIHIFYWIWDFGAGTTQAFLLRKPKVLCIEKHFDRSKKCNQNMAVAQNKAKTYETFGLFVTYWMQMVCLT